MIGFDWAVVSEAWPDSNELVDKASMWSALGVEVSG